MSPTLLENIDPILRGVAINLQQDVALQRSQASDKAAQFKQPPNKAVLPTFTSTRKRRHFKMDIQKPPIELRERYPSGRLKEFRPRCAYDQATLVEIRKEERIRSVRYKDGLLSLAVAAGHCDAVGQAAFIVELKRLRKEKREAKREARNAKIALTASKLDAPKGEAGVEPQVVNESEEIFAGPGWRGWTL